MRAVSLNVVTGRALTEVWPLPRTSPSLLQMMVADTAPL
jgi:hypothetical protein